MSDHQWLITTIQITFHSVQSFIPHSTVRQKQGLMIELRQSVDVCEGLHSFTYMLTVTCTSYTVIYFNDILLYNYNYF